MKSVYRTLLDVVHYQKMDAKRLHKGDEEVKQTFFQRSMWNYLRNFPENQIFMRDLLQPQVQALKNRKISKRETCFSFSGEQGRILVKQEKADFMLRSTSCCAVTLGPASPSSCNVYSTWYPGTSMHLGRASVQSA